MSDVLGASAAGVSNPPSAGVPPSAAGSAADPNTAPLSAEPPAGDPSRIVELNVGGVLYTTTLGTLQMHPTSQLGQTFQEPFSLPQDSAGRYFMDRNGALFSHVLDYLRDGSIQGVGPDDIPKITQLAAEFAHLGLPHILPFEELFKREDWTTYSMSSSRAGRAAHGVFPGHSCRGAPQYTHVRVKVRGGTAVAQVDVPSGSRVPRPTTAFLDDVLEHYGAFGYIVTSVVAVDGGHAMQYTLARDGSGDVNGAFPSSNGTRPGSHPASNAPPSQAGAAGGAGGLPPQVLEILGRVRDINKSIGSVPR